MTRFLASLRFCSRWQIFTAAFCFLVSGNTCLGQHHAGHHHAAEGRVGGFRTSGPASFGGPGMMQQFGGGSYNYGGYNSSGAFNGPYNGPYNYNYGGFDANRPLGGVSFGNSFGTATYSSRNFGVTTYGIGNSGFGGVNYGMGYGYPAIFSTPMYNYSPSVFGYGTGVFSPNFPSGNYVTNGYVGYVPNGAYNIQPMMTMQPFVPSVNTYQLVDPRMIDNFAPVMDLNGQDPNGLNPNGVGKLPVPMPPEPDDLPAIEEEPPLPVQPDGVPVLNEFNAVPRDHRDSSLVEKIQSLRYQASGDDAFRKSDYATADVLYATAIKTAPDRRAPYLRMAVSRIALRDFSNAVSYLKTGLTMESDPSRPWFTVEELYGEKVAERVRTHGGPLWNWLAERPLSADRLLLAGTFQKLRGYGDVADQMLAMASHDGPEAKLVAEVSQLAAADIGQRAISHDLDQMVKHASITGSAHVAPDRSPSDEEAVKQAGGIFLRGGNATSATRSAEDPSELPGPMPVTPQQELPIPLEIPVQE